MKPRFTGLKGKCPNCNKILDVDVNGTIPFHWHPLGRKPARFKCVGAGKKVPVFPKISNK